MWAVVSARSLNITLWLSARASVYYVLCSELTRCSARVRHKLYFWRHFPRSLEATVLARALNTAYIIVRSAPAQQRPPRAPQSAHATGLAAARALSKDHSTGSSARAQHRQQDWPQRAALHRPQPQRARSAQAIAAARALSTGNRNWPRNWPQSARSAQATETGHETGRSERAISTGHSTGRSARAHHRP